MSAPASALTLGKRVEVACKSIQDSLRSIGKFPFERGEKHRVVINGVESREPVFDIGPPGALPHFMNIRLAPNSGCLVRERESYKGPVVYVPLDIMDCYYIGDAQTAVRQLELLAEYVKSETERAIGR